MLTIILKPAILQCLIQFFSGATYLSSNLSTCREVNRYCRWGAAHQMWVEYINTVSLPHTSCFDSHTLFVHVWINLFVLVTHLLSSVCYTICTSQIALISWHPHMRISAFVDEFYWPHALSHFRWSEENRYIGRLVEIQLRTTLNRTSGVKC